uniref:tumor protein D52 isoform X2 n=1 Tax=Ciona intestinalis TaxID=7719 RepID=UPI000EF4FACF|nr:tumor protein D52 isoform X2 [Ciona intestinalis]|eukprot:XP_026692632.1 tumor protein D52 isoform X2 [Ciona intestinalis]
MNETESEKNKRIEEICHEDSYKQYLSLVSEDINEMFEFSAPIVRNPHFNPLQSETEPSAPTYPDLSTQDRTPPAEIPSTQTEDDLWKKEKHDELVKIEDEIDTLRQVLTAKEREASELRKLLGLTPLGILKADINKIQSSQAYKKTVETLKSAEQATASAFSSLGSSMSMKFSEMKNSPTYKSFEEKVEGVGSTIMAKVSGTPRETPAATPDETPQAPITQQPHAGDDLPM